MPKRPEDSSVSRAASDHGTSNVPAAELLSFLKQTRAIQTWIENDLAKALKISLSDATEGDPPRSLFDALLHNAVDAEASPTPIIDAGNSLWPAAVHVQPLARLD
jgi:hypothetical protein